MDFDSETINLDLKDSFSYKGLELLYKYDINLAENYASDVVDFSIDSKKSRKLYLLNKLLEMYCEGFY